MKKIKMPVILIAVSFIVGIFAYSKMPTQVASHWGTTGEVNGYMDKFWGTFFLPLFLVGLYLLLYFVPKLDPRRNNIDKFKGSYNKFLNMFFSFMFTIYLFTIAWNLGYHINIDILIPIIIAGLFYSVGVLISEAKPNYFIGIRTPWTLSSDDVWEKTHRIGGSLYKLAAFVTLIGLFFGNYMLWFMLTSVLGVTIYLVFFSYFEFKKEQKK
jgi:uncharacterized membrane protein